MEENKKVYEFRTLCSDDMFIMFQIVSKIGINEFKESIKEIMSGFVNATSEKGEGNDQQTTVLGISVILEIANVVLGNLPKCKDEIYQILSQTSNLKVDQIRKMDVVTFTEMVIDFVKKEEFKDFLRVVSKLFNK